MWGLLSDVLDDLLEGPLPAVHLYDLYAVQHLVQQVDPSVALLGGYSPVFWQETGLKLINLPDFYFFTNSSFIYLRLVHIDIN